ncbi:MAG: GMP/IMP nucleotidase [Gammaproteobacteria bacterium]|nr:GMP/IMP nucleotidase [Gammaproteobacteria bacterium]
MVDWSEVETVLLDMDGTLIDLYFDNFLWNQRLPEVVAAARGIGVAAAREQLYGHMRGIPRSLDYYSLDYWSRYAGLDIVGLHRELSHLIAYRANASRFVRAVRASGRRAVLVTNAHPKSLAVKDARLDLTVELDAHYSAHAFGHPKQYGEFWSALNRHDPYDPARTLFIDDDEDVLGAALESGIDQVLCVAQPDSQAPKRSALPFTALDDFEEIMPF